ncbi:hypothetical protein CJP74_04540 [Psittacicella melopsittaci]|uniref:Pseudouridine synthase n=1 Tax=Psittacicella melopsittaci TaxID=2028576 RepID=A0A3A1Y5H6_9GAMM|nr:RluA family pseudouridine synthase [Psittacicella melopsittaci]RIY32458.1 hypothetical protein CJP74_04540 [Psittacicella melopsittaci]
MKKTNSQKKRVNLSQDKKNLQAKRTNLQSKKINPKSTNTSSARLKSEAIVKEKEYLDLEHREAFKAPADVAIGQEYRTPVVELVAKEEDQDRRIDNFLISILPNIPKTNFYKLLRKGEIRINKGRIKPEYKINQGDVIRIAPLILKNTPDKSIELQDIVKLNSVKVLKDNIVYEDKGLFIINKPAGIAVHGGSGLSYGVVEALRVLFPKEKRLELVHRIDKETSGLLMVARKASVLKALQDQFRNKTIHKSYLCLVPGVWQEDFVDAPLLRYEKLGERFVKVDEQGKESRTNFKLVQLYEDSNGEKFSLVEASPLTGRTHQIRVHALHALAPLAGDSKYQDLIATSYLQKLGLNRMFLHAYKLNYIDPESQERKIVQIPLAPELENFLAKLKPITL